MTGTPCPVLEDNTVPPVLPVVASYVVDSRETEVRQTVESVNIAPANKAIGLLSSEYV